MAIKREENKEQYFKGCLIGGAIGDALGYPVEFMSYNEILRVYGKDGITHYKLASNGKALISDDTQMTLFTANGILIGNTRGCMRGVEGLPHGYIHMAYLDWLTTQGYKKPTDTINISWLLKVPELHNCRAPGNTCISALCSPEERSVEKPLNKSKGCGGVMRIAPYGLFYGKFENEQPQLFITEAAEIGAITHGQTMSHLSCSLMASIIGQIIYGSAPGAGEHWDALEEIVSDALFQVKTWGVASRHKEEFDALMKRAVELTKNNSTDEENIRSLGEGWVAEEALAIAIYCACKYQNESMKGIIAAVNHSGDSDSTGAIAGNILGAWNGYDAFPKEFIKDLEIADVIEEIATDLSTGCPMSEYGSYRDQKWIDKYIEMDV